MHRPAEDQEAFINGRGEPAEAVSEAAKQRVNPDEWDIGDEDWPVSREVLHAFITSHSNSRISLSSSIVKMCFFINVWFKRRRELAGAKNVYVTPGVTTRNVTTPPTTRLASSRGTSVRITAIS